MTSRSPAASHDRYGHWGAIFVAPAVAFFATFSIFPILFGFYLSLTDFNLLTPPQFSGLSNYTSLAGDRLFLKALGNTLFFVLGATVPVWVFSLAIAKILDAPMRGKRYIRAVLFSPVLPPLVVVAVVWRMLLHPHGILTAAVGPFLGTTEIRWLNDVALAPWVMIFAYNWATVPFFMMLWLVGLNALPKDVLEAAELDGAVGWRRFLRIEMPLMRSTAILVATLSTINAFQSFEIQFVLSPDKGGPANSTMTLGLLVWKYAFQYYRMGSAAAVSVVLFAMILFVSTINLWLNAIAKRRFG